MELIFTFNIDIYSVWINKCVSCGVIKGLTAYHFDRDYIKIYNTITCDYIYLDEYTIYSSHICKLRGKN